MKECKRIIVKNIKVGINAIPDSLSNQTGMQESHKDF
jgi:hypothetical protein